LSRSGSSKGRGNASRSRMRAIVSRLARAPDAVVASDGCDDDLALECSSPRWKGKAPRPDKPLAALAAEMRWGGGAGRGVRGLRGEGGVNVAPNGLRGGRAAIGLGGTNGNASRIESARDDVDDRRCGSASSSSSNVATDRVEGAFALVATDVNVPRVMRAGEYVPGDVIPRTTRVALPISAMIVPVPDWVLSGRSPPDQPGVGGNVHCVGVCCPNVEVDLTDEADEAKRALASSPNGLTSSGPNDAFESGDFVAGRDDVRERGCRGAWTTSALTTPST